VSDAETPLPEVIGFQHGFFRMLDEAISRENNCNESDFIRFAIDHFSPDDYSTLKKNRPRDWSTHNYM